MNDEALTITRVAVSVLSTPIDEPVPMSFGRLVDRRVCVVEIEAGGHTGVGESWVNYPAWGHHERVATLIEGVAPLLLGRDARRPAAIQAELAAALGPVGRQAGAPGPIWQALSGVDVAAWDLLGRATGQPIHALLGGDATRTSVPVYASGVGPTQVADLCARAAAAKITTIKAKIGFGSQVDAGTLTEIRSHLPDAVLLADANQAWSVSEAAGQADLLADHRVAWLEEPVAGDQLADLAALAELLPIPLASGENVYGLDEFERRINAGVIGYHQPDLAKSGGFTVANAIARAAAGRGTQVAPHCYSSGLGLLAAVQFAAAWSHVSTVELDVRDNPLRTELLGSATAVVGGRIAVPTGPGLGATLDDDVVDDLRIHLQERTL